MASKSSSKPSKLLNSQENQLLIKLLGNKVQSLATAVVQFFIAFGDEWSLHVSLPLQSTIIITKFYAKKQFKNVYQMLSYKLSLPSHSHYHYHTHFHPNN